VVGAVDLAADRLQEQLLFAPAELLMAGLVLGRFDRVGRHEGAFRVDRGMVDAQGIGFRVRVMVGRFDAFPAASLARIETDPFGPIMSFTKKAVSLIIGPSRPHISRPSRR
jgi:hypothetical protein